MRTDLDELLAGSASGPGAQVDVDALWTTGRRRRRVRQLTAVGGSVAGIALVALAVSTLGLGGPGTPEVSPLDAPDEEEAPEETPPEDPEPEDQAPPEPADEGDAEVDLAPDDTDDAELDDDAAGTDDDAGAETQTETEPEPDPEPGPSPDAGALADPCASHDPNDFVTFIDVVGPVPGQHVGSQIELVGCSRVNEGTVRYRVLQGQQVLVDSFTTATFGGPELGEFRETISVDAVGDLVLEVFWDSPADGSEQDAATITITAS